MAQKERPMRILCVCLGNICRSPMAEGALRKRGAEVGLVLEVDSAGTGAYHIGNPPDPRGLAAASARGYDNSALRARQVREADFHDFDLIVAMDRANLRNLQAMAPAGSRAEIRLFDAEGREIPDPYYGGPADYEKALDMVEAATEALIGTLLAARPAGARP
ncbi:low molecular weight phosphotyrosine protein phosphatase [Rhodobacteraceae bacterium NNCM2]|nr:low molecular weight phosphotyrosine protein phosphatase [Coraliihabitans acroporae]